MLFEAAELLTQSLTFCAFKGILGCCRKPRDWTTSRRLREISTSTIYHHASEKANFRLNSKHKTHLFRRKMAEAACFVIRAETTQPGPSRLREGLLSHLPEIQQSHLYQAKWVQIKKGRSWPFCSLVPSSSCLNMAGLRLKMVHLNEHGCQKWK